MALEGMFPVHPRSHGLAYL